MGIPERMIREGEGRLEPLCCNASCIPNCAPKTAQETESAAAQTQYTEATMGTFTGTLQTEHTAPAEIKLSLWFGVPWLAWARMSVWR